MVRGSGENSAIAPEAADSARSVASGYWVKFVVIYLAGVLAAASIGKIGPVAGALRAQLGLSLGQVGLIASSVTATAAVLGLLVGAVTQRFTKKPLLLAGLAVMVLAGFAVAWAPSFQLLLAARLAESLGYVLVVVTAPVLVMSLGGGVRQTAALAVWGTFLPVGLALGSFAGGVAATVLDPAGWLGLAAGALAVVGIVACFAAPRAASGPRPKVARVRTPGRSLRRFAHPLMLSGGFATASATIVALVALLPSYLTEVHGVAAGQAGTITGAVSLIGVLGGFWTSWLVRRGARLGRIFLAGLVMPVGALLTFLQLGGLPLTLVGAVLVALANEVVVAAVFAAVPVVAGGRRNSGGDGEPIGAGTSDAGTIDVGTSADETIDDGTSGDGDLSTANGLIAQFGSIGSLAGPPLAGLVVTVGGWWLIGPVTLLACGVGVVLLRRSVRVG